MVIYLAPNYIFVQYIHVSPCLVYYSLLKSIDLTNREKAFKYLVTSSLFEGWGGKSLLWSLYVVSRNFFGVPVFCVHELDVPLTVLPHCRGKSGCLLI